MKLCYQPTQSGSPLDLTSTMQSLYSMPHYDKDEDGKDSDSPNPG